VTSDSVSSGAQRSGDESVLRLGHIEYSNCLPIHAELLRAPGPDLRIVRGTPAALNEALAAGDIDVAPCSSIEYARHAEQYRILPDLAIGSLGPVRSIRFESTRALGQLGSAQVAVPSASATSVVLLRILLELRYGAPANFVWYDQETGADPIADGADAALWIGDIALRRNAPAGRSVHDLGQLWTDWTGLPFAFAVWQTPLPSTRDSDLNRLQQALLASRRRSLRDTERLADEWATEFGVDARMLAAYWRGLQYDLDPAMQRGLLHFFEHAVSIGELSRLPSLHFVTGGM
jgi:chorismate dehydratase